jgi:threonylcarbamoyladenosine tRNA methylthiotransferase MtaB
MTTPVDNPTAPGSSVAFRTIGCRLNQCETAQMQESLAAAGYRLVDWRQPADVRVINTCTVTAKSDRTCRHQIRLAKRLDPECTVVVTGCFAQVDPAAVAAIPGVDLVLGNLDKLRLAEALRQAAAGPLVAVSAYGDRPRFEGRSFSDFHGYTRAFLKIQNGCDSHCAYCVVPQARGPARSMPAAEVLEQVSLLVGRGFREIVLTGINLGSWGRDSGEGTLADLLESLLRLRGPGGPGRLRLSSIEPLEVDQALMEVIERAGERVAHHFHLPLQSGSDSVLERMGRPYRASEYLAVAAELARRFPDAALGADLITGFPGETDEESAETLAFVERAPLTYLHVFSYSDRPGTRATAMRPKVSPETIHARGLALRSLGERKDAAFRDRLRGSEQRVLVLKERGVGGRLVGITGNYMEVLLEGDDALANRFVRALLERPGPDGRWEAAILAVDEEDET